MIEISSDQHKYVVIRATKWDLPQFTSILFEFIIGCINNGPEVANIALSIYWDAGILRVKNNLLNSKIWGASIVSEGGAGGSERKVNDNDNDNDNRTSDGDSSLLLFKRIELNVIEKELNSKQQREHIKSSIDIERAKWESDWNKLTSNTFAVINYHNNNSDGNSSKVVQPFQSDFAMKELPFDNVNGFNGSYEYDNNSYLTKLDD